MLEYPARSRRRGAAAHDVSTVLSEAGMLDAFLKAALSEAPPLFLRAVPARA